MPVLSDLPPRVRVPLSRLARRLLVGQFLDVWPPWAAAALVAAGVTALACRLLAPAAAPFLAWLWLAPALAAAAAAVATWRRRYSPMDVVAVADWLGGATGTLLAVAETDAAAWIESPPLRRASMFALPRLRPWRRLMPAAAAAVFLAAALALPQRTPAASNAALADDIAGGLTKTVAELKQQQLVTPEEEKALEEAIERIRRGADQRVDASSWEAADALKEKLAADAADKRDALQWAADSLARYAAATQASGAGTPAAAASAAELTAALEKLAKSGLLAGAPEQLRGLLKGGKLPTDPKALATLSAAMSKYLAESNGRMGDLAKLGREFGRFNPSEFPLETGASGDPGSGGLDRGRADAALTWGKETMPFDKFKSHALPPGAPRSPDDWAPVVELPGAPQASPDAGAAGAARQYEAGAGQGAWRRTLAPRHQSAVKRYFAK